MQCDIAWERGGSGGFGNHNLNGGTSSALFPAVAESSLITSGGAGVGSYPSGGGYAPSTASSAADYFVAGSNGGTACAETASGWTTFHHQGAANFGVVDNYAGDVFGLGHHHHVHHQSAAAFAYGHHHHHNPAAAAAAAVAYRNYNLAKGTVVPGGSTTAAASFGFY